MRIGVPKEIKVHEYRVGMTPAAAREAVEHGHQVFVEHDAAARQGITDKDYERAGAKVLATAAEVFTAADLRDRKVANIRSMRPDLVATGNIGCITQLASGMDIPIAHTVELLDWAYGGPMPRGLEALAKHVQDVPEAKPLFAVT